MKEWTDFFSDDLLKDPLGNNVPRDPEDLLFFSSNLLPMGNLIETHYKLRVKEILDDFPESEDPTYDGIIFHDEPEVEYPMVDEPVPDNLPEDTTKGESLEVEDCSPIQEPPENIDELPTVPIPKMERGIYCQKLDDSIKCKSIRINATRKQFLNDNSLFSASLSNWPEGDCCSMRIPQCRSNHDRSIKDHNFFLKLPCRSSRADFAVR